jgi:sulfoxide reductase heme-binding subunit YedZ
MRASQIKPILFTLCLLPFASLTFGIIQNDLGPNPVEAALHATGEWSLRLLLITLTMTPLRRMLGQPWPIQLRRMLGLFTFFYASLHFTIWLWVDQAFSGANIINDITERPYITVGFMAWLLLLVLAGTSNHYSIKRLGKSWKSLHRAVYVAAIFGVLHFIWLVKADWLEPLIYALILTILLAVRLFFRKNSQSWSIKHA